MTDKKEVKILSIVFSLFLGVLLIPLWNLVNGSPIDGFYNRLLMVDFLGMLSIDWLIAIGLFTMAILFLCRGKEKKIIITIVNIVMMVLWILFENDTFGNVFELMVSYLSLVALMDLTYSIAFLFKNAYQITGPRRQEF
jgi:hypothetical protein